MAARPALDARGAKFVVVKNPMNHRLGYAGLARAAFILDTPGPTPAVLRHVKYRQMQRPYYPADRDVPVSMDIVMDVARAEFRKLELPIVEREFEVEAGVVMHA